jgi:hypothetical protein
MKKCTKCGETKSLDEFHKGKHTKDGYRTQCITCEKSYDFQNKLKRKKRLDKTKKERAEYQREYYSLHKENLDDYYKRYWEINRSRKNSNGAKRHASKLQRTPKWLTKDQLKEIENFYILARKKTLETGILHEVDHIVPLKPRSKLVSGLHVPWNLQVITKEENVKKSDKI